jgi:hypothetical protein
LVKDTKNKKYQKWGGKGKKRENKNYQRCALSSTSISWRTPFIFLEIPNPSVFLILFKKDTKIESTKNVGKWDCPFHLHIFYATFSNFDFTKKLWKDSYYQGK